MRKENKQGPAMLRLTTALIASAALSVGFSQIASAADMPAQAPVYKAAPVYAAYNWSGFYVGVHGGWATGDATSGVLGVSADIDGWFIGGQLGYNWQAPGSSLVLGVEADGSWADIGDSWAVTVGAVTLTASTDLDFLGTLRARVGYAWDRALLYATGGLAMASNEVSFGVTALGFTAGVSDSQTHVGWTVGGGFEWAFTPNWSAKIEYLYMDLGSETYFPAVAGGFDGDIDLHTVKFGFNYRF